MKNWEKRAAALLNRSLRPVPSELNEMDWKSDISNKSERLAQHISSFANLPGGGFFVFGIDNSGEACGLTQEQCEKIIHHLGQLNHVTLLHIIPNCLTRLSRRNYAL